MNRNDIEMVLDDLIALRMQLETICETLDRLTAKRAKDWLREN